MELVKHGIRWSVGDGKKIKLLTDNWIPNIAPGSFKTLMPVPSNVTVDFLLLEDHSSWDAVIVHSVFEEEVVNQVLQIPVSSRVGEDFLVALHQIWSLHCLFWLPLGKNREVLC
jgi:hypothetical protein